MSAVCVCGHVDHTRVVAGSATLHCSTCRCDEYCGYRGCHEHSGEGRAKQYNDHAARWKALARKLFARRNDWLSFVAPDYLRAVAERSRRCDAAEAERDALKDKCERFWNEIGHASSCLKRGVPPNMGESLAAAAVRVGKARKAAEAERDALKVENEALTAETLRPRTAEEIRDLANASSVWICPACSWPADHEAELQQLRAEASDAIAQIEALTRRVERAVALLRSVEHVRFGEYTRCPRCSRALEGELGVHTSQCSLGSFLAEVKS